MDQGSDQTSGSSTRPAFAPRERLSQISPAEVIAAALSVVWLLGVVIYFIVGGSTEGQGTATILMTILGVILPIALIWLAASAARTARLLREESFRLQGALDTMRRQQSAGSVTFQRGAQKGTAPSARDIASAPTVTFASRRDPALRHGDDETGPLFAAGQPDGSQPRLALETPEPDLPPLPMEDFIRALNFPESPEDREGFRALRAALNHRDSAKLVRSAQDVLTLLSQDGIYMDDLIPDLAPPELWRRFANGERGAAIAPLAGINDRSSLALAAGRMRQDTVFRDAAHHFLRQFDRSFQSFEKLAGDAEIMEAADTRSARAFMLLGRVTGIFGQTQV